MQVGGSPLTEPDPAAPLAPVRQFAPHFTRRQAPQMRCRQVTVTLSVCAHDVSPDGDLCVTLQHAPCTV